MRVAEGQFDISRSKFGVYAKRGALPAVPSDSPQPSKMHKTTGPDVISLPFLLSTGYEGDCANASRWMPRFCVFYDLSIGFVSHIFEHFQKKLRDFLVQKCENQKLIVVEVVQHYVNSLERSDLSYVLLNGWLLWLTMLYSR